MQQIRESQKNKRTAQITILLSVNQSWWSIKDVKITFGADPESDTEEMRKLLDESLT